MQISHPQNDGVIETLDRLCSTTSATYPIKNKMADYNDALDWYFQLAFEADGRWSFDDVNNSSPPIDTQNLVSGTNRYKVGTFTEKIINLLRLEILDSNGVGQPLVMETLETMGTSDILGNTSGRRAGSTSETFQERYLNAPSGTPTHYIKYGDFIYLYPNPDYSYTAGLKAYFERPASYSQFVSVTPEADDETFTVASAHGLVANDRVLFEVDSSGTISTGLTADTTYWVISSGLTTTVFKVSATQGGSSVNITTDGSNVYYLHLSKTPGVPLIHHMALCRKAALQFRSYPANAGSQGSLSSLFAQVQKDERMIQDYFSRRSKDDIAILQAIEQNNE